MLYTTLVLGFFLSVASGYETVIYKHKWDTVADLMAMHGKDHDLTELPPDEALKFAAENYATVTTGGSCVDNIVG